MSESTLVTHQSQGKDKIWVGSKQKNPGIQVEGHKSIQYVQGSETVKLKKDLRVKVNCYGCCSVTQLCPTLCDSVNWSIPGLPVLHHLPELSEIHVHWIGDAIQPSYPLSSPFPPACRTVMVKLVLTFCPDGLSPDWKQLETEF